jgi:pimeloyl-ACP methyl ester carboxylesterase
MSLAPAPLARDTRGSGPDLLFLPGMNGMLFSTSFVDALAASFRVTVPQLPGWGDADREPSYRSFDDLSYAVLDLLNDFDTPVSVVGCSTGAWLAAEVATKSTAKISKLALVSPVGTRYAEPTERAYLDIYASSAEKIRIAMYGQTTPPPDLSKLSDAQFLELARAQEAVTYYAWEPYMHNRGLLERLHSVDVPTMLVTGEEDGFVLREDHLALLQAELPQIADIVVIPAVGHRIEEQAPAELATSITGFIAGN